MSKRYFYISITGDLPNDSKWIGTFDLTQPKYPSHKSIKVIAADLTPNLTNILVLGITEMSESDYKTFRGE